MFLCRSFTGKIALPYNAFGLTCRVPHATRPRLAISPRATSYTVAFSGTEKSSGRDETKSGTFLEHLLNGRQQAAGLYQGDERPNPVTNTASCLHTETHAGLGNEERKGRLRMESIFFRRENGFKQAGLSRDFCREGELCDEYGPSEDRRFGVDSPLYYDAICSTQANQSARCPFAIAPSSSTSAPRCFAHPEKILRRLPF